MLPLSSLRADTSRIAHPPLIYITDAFALCSSKLISAEGKCPAVGGQISSMQIFRFFRLVWERWGNGKSLKLNSSLASPIQPSVLDPEATMSYYLESSESAQHNHKGLSMNWDMRKRRRHPHRRIPGSLISVGMEMRDFTGGQQNASDVFPSVLPTTMLVRALQSNSKGKKKEDIPEC